MKEHNVLKPGVVTTRVRLPNRRPSEVIAFEHDGIRGYDGRRSQISRDLDRAARSWRWSEPLCLAESGKLAQIIARTRRHPADVG